MKQFFFSFRSAISYSRIMGMLLLAWSFNSSVKADGVHEYTRKVSASGLVNNAVFNISDPAIRQVNMTEMRSDVYAKSNYSTKVSLVYGRENKQDHALTTSWSCTVSYTISFLNENGVQQGATITGNNLSIQFDPNNSSNNNYLSQQVFNLTAHDYPHARIIITNVVGTLPSDARLEIALINTHAYNLLTDSYQMPIYAYYNSTKDQLYWPYIKGAKAYQVEWVYIDEKNTQTTFPNNDPFQYKEPVRITTTNQYFSFSHFTYPKGTLYFRVRCIGQFMDGSSTEKYSWVFSPASPLAVDNSYESAKNWQYVTSYAEDGSYKKIVSYYDGSMRSRQTLTNLSSENNTLAKETKYDYEGRPVVEVLPVPLTSNALNYVPGLNTFGGGKKDYDQRQVAGFSVAGLSSASGAAGYYSAANSITGVNSDYIPDAEGYPFTQVMYELDGTGKPTMQSSLGKDFHLQDPTLGAHYARYKYDDAKSTELYRLFGSNVGDASHYTKTYTIDPNGQIAIAYKDQEERVVATALMSNSPNVNNNGANLIGLNSTSFPITVSLDGNNRIDYTTNSSTSTSYITNMLPGSYRFTYSLKGAINQSQFFSTCKACEYDLNITIKDPDGLVVGTPVVQTGLKPVATCTAGVTSYDLGNIVDFSATFSKEGTYTIIKKLTLSSGALDLLMSSLEHEAGYPDYNTYVQQHVNAVDLSECDFSCEDNCRSEVIRLHPDWNTTQVEQGVLTCMNDQCAGYVSQVMEQVATDQCASLLGQMKQQVSPGGLYNGKDWWINNVFNNLQTFTDANNQPIAGPATINELTDPSLFNDDWADELATYHPEYCQYNLCLMSTDSRVFDNEMALVRDWNEASAKSYLSSNPSDIDPLFNPIRYPNMGFDYPTALAKSNIVSRILNYQTINGVAYSLEQFAGSTYANNGTVPTSEQKWNVYRSLYMGLKMREFKNLASTNPPPYGSSSIFSYCPYSTDPDAIVLDPTLADDAGQIDNLVHTTMNQDCQGLCNANVKTWIVMIEGHCGELDNSVPVENSDSTLVAQNLLSYCNSTCGFSNPLALLLKEDINKPQFVAIQNILNKPLYNGCQLIDMTVEDPYIKSCQNGVYTEFWNMMYPSPSCGNSNDCSNLTYAFPNRPPDLIKILPNINLGDLPGEMNFPAPLCDTYILAKLTTKLYVASDGMYSLKATFDNGARIYINDVEFTDADSWTPTYMCMGNGLRTKTGGVYLRQGYNDIYIEYAQAELSYKLSLEVMQGNYVLFQDNQYFHNTESPELGCEAIGIKECAMDFNPQGNCNDGSAATPTYCAKEILSGINRILSARRNQNYTVGCPSSYDISKVYYQSNVAQYVTAVTNTCSGSLPGYTTITDFVHNGTSDENLYGFNIYNGDADSYFSEGLCIPDFSYQSGQVMNNQHLMFYLLDNNNNKVYVPKDRILSIGDVFVDCDYLASSGAAYNIGSSFALAVPARVQAFNGSDNVTDQTLYIESSGFTTNSSFVTWKTGGLPDNTLCNIQFTVDWDKYKTDCQQSLVEQATYEAWVEWNDAVDQFKANFLEEHLNKCMASPDFEEHFRYQGTSMEHQYTLYYYDQAGNLVQTVPPAGVNPLDGSAFDANGNYKAGQNYEPQHRLLTKYRYNALNQLIWQNTPDGGETYFFYNEKGQLKLSQNKKQAGASGSSFVYSYSTYDELGRIQEVGELQNIPYSVADFLDPLKKSVTKDLLATANLASVYTANQKTVTTYDAGISGQENLRNRIALVQSYDAANALSAATSYSYDFHGNVKKMTQQLSGYASKTIEYTYDLISNKVKKVTYQKDQPDQFIHCYRYDADNRLVSAKTSANGFAWNEDAHYFYYKHGVLARTELGESKVQGQDHYYTIQGWIKGMNMPAQRTNTSGTGYLASADPGLDGMSATGNLNRYVAQDEFAYTLGYFKDDYKPTGTAANLGAASQAWTTGGELKNGILENGLYNGNISYMLHQVHSLPKLYNGTLNETDNLRGNAYRYDQLNRLKEARSYTWNSSATSWTRGGDNTINAHAYDAAYNYDRNGNIEHAYVNGLSGTVLMDDLEYHYDVLTDGTGKLSSNRLYHVNDAIGSSPEAGDLNDEGTWTNAAAGNYRYDEIGNLTNDIQEGTAIKWNVYGKVTEVRKTDGSQTITFLYDGAGNRIKKSVTNISGTSETWYMRDGSGNVLATYDVKNGNTICEFNIYGSSRIGNYKPASLTGEYNQWKPASRHYELTNHLGNVMALISSWKLGAATAAGQNASFYNADVTMASDYYPFGAQLPGRMANTGDSHYGFNGQEKIGELDEIYDFGKRMYDPRLGRLLSVDPLTKDYPWYTPYQFAGNTPIQAIDLLGEQPAYIVRKWTHSDNYGGLYSNTAEFQSVLKNVKANTVNVSALLQNEDVHGGTLEVTYTPEGKLVSAKWTGYKEKSIIDKNFSASPQSSTESLIEVGGLGGNAKASVIGVSVTLRVDLYGTTESSAGLGGTLEFSATPWTKWVNGKGFDWDWNEALGFEMGAYAYGKTLNTVETGFKRGGKGSVDGSVVLGLSKTGLKTETSYDDKGNLTVRVGPSVGFNVGDVVKYFKGTKNISLLKDAKTSVKAGGSGKYEFKYFTRQIQF